MTTPTEFLKKALQTVQERQGSYGHAEETLALVAQRWSLTLGHPVSAQQVALCMIDLKLVRLMRNPLHLDSLIDAIGYAACLATIAEQLLYNDKKL